MLAPILSAPPQVQIHIVCALTAIAFLPFQFMRRKRDRMHKITGYIWVLAMGGTALSSFLIHDIRLVGLFSPIHLLSAWVLFSLVTAIWAAKNGNITAHRQSMASSAFWGLGVAGMFTFLPGRLMNEVLFGSLAMPGFVVLSVLFATIAIRYFRPVPSRVQPSS